MDTEQKEMELTLDFHPVGNNGSATITARRGKDVLAVEKVDLSQSKRRAEFAALVAEKVPAIDAKDVEAELLQQAAKLAAPKANSEEPVAPSGEIDASRIIRPERFIVPEASGLAVPTMTTAGDKVQGRWQLFIRWASGKRERRPLGTALDLPNGDRLYVSPEAGEPSPSSKPGWTAKGREKWLEGEAAPNPAEVFQRACTAIACYLELPSKAAPGTTATLALWAILTYCFGAWGAVPYLYLGGPLGSGKSRVFEILARLCFRPLSTSNLTAASLFRTQHAYGGTLLLDEAERLKRSKDPDVAEILSMLLAGYKAGGSAVRLEPVGESGFKTVAFDVYGPKSLACIAGLPPALASRAINITMFRAPPGSEKPRRRIDANPARWTSLRDDLHALALEHGPAFLRLADNTDVCPVMSGRDFEKWQPLLALASWLEESGAEGLLALMQEHALSVIETGKDEQIADHDETLLRLLADAVRQSERPTPGELLDLAKESEPDGFKRWTAKGVSEHLRRYGLQTIKSHGRKRYAHVTADDLGRVQASYGFDLGFKLNRHPWQRTPCTPCTPTRIETPRNPGQNAGARIAATYPGGARISRTYPITKPRELQVQTESAGHVGHVGHVCRGRYRCEMNAFSAASFLTGLYDKPNVATTTQANAPCEPQASSDIHPIDAWFAAEDFSKWYYVSGWGWRGPDANEMEEPFDELRVEPCPPIHGSYSWAKPFFSSHSPTSSSSR